MEKCERKIEDLTRDLPSAHQQPNHSHHHNGNHSQPDSSFTSSIDSSSLNGGFVPDDDDDNLLFESRGGGDVGRRESKMSDSLNRASNNNNNNNIKNDSFSTPGNDALAFWERQRRLFDRMHLTFVNAEPPLAPASVKLEIAGSESLLVNISEPRNTGAALVTTYKVEWSVNSRFDALEGEQSAFGVDNVDVKIANLIPGQPYFVRVSAMNLKGYGPYRTSDPASAAPSSWKEVASRKRGEAGDGLMKLNSLIDEVLGSATGSLQRGEGGGGGAGKDSRKRSFVKTMFASHSKMVRASNLRRGFYLSCLLYHQNMILVSNHDGVLPTCKIDDAVPTTSAIVTDLLWFMKVAATWEDIRTLQQEMASAGEEISDAVYWRLKV